jgi:hypothetical protein
MREVATRREYVQSAVACDNGPCRMHITFSGFRIALGMYSLYERLTVSSPSEPAQLDELQFKLCTHFALRSTPR